MLCSVRTIHGCIFLVVDVKSTVRKRKPVKTYLLYEPEEPSKFGIFVSKESCWSEIVGEDNYNFAFGLWYLIPCSPFYFTEKWLEENTTLLGKMKPEIVEDMLDTIADMAKFKHDKESRYTVEVAKNVLGIR